MRDKQPSPNFVNVLAILVALIVIAWVAAGCAPMTPEQRADQEFARADRANRCVEMARSCQAVGGTLVSLAGGGMTQCNRGSRSAMYCPDLER